MSERSAIVIGNWKMHGRRASVTELDALIRELGIGVPPACEVMLCPPATLIAEFAERAAAGRVRIGGQDCHPETDGPFTGDLSAGMLADAGAEAVIVGHSERRAGYGESDALVRAKAEAVHQAGLIAIICVGESEAERDAGAAEQVIAVQTGGSVPGGATADNTILAYEPVWAIGSGRTPSSRDIVAAHEAVQAQLTQQLGADARGVRILYGGSVKPGNARDILSLPGVDGALVGGASLRWRDFFAIVSACPRRSGRPSGLGAPS